MESNETEGVIYKQATEWGERRDVAETFCAKVSLTIPCVVDTIDNAVDEQYAGWPERLFVLDREGKVAYAGRRGPWGFKPEEAERALRRVLRRGK